MLIIFKELEVEVILLFNIIVLVQVDIDNISRLCSVKFIFLLNLVVMIFKKVNHSRFI